MNHPDVVNQYYYKTGIDNYNHIILVEDIESDQDLIAILNNHTLIYTDVIDKPMVFNRAKLVSESQFKLNFSNYNVQKVIQYKSLYGSNFIHRISKK